jgi:hypothetical protein
MNMKRNLSICFFAACFLAVIGISSQSERTQEPDVENAEAKTERESETEPDVPVTVISQPEYKYIIFSEDGVLVVYYADSTTVFFNSGIRKETLPDELKERLTDGIAFATEEELYEFLENYSS